MACKFAVDVNAEALASMVTRAVLVPDDGEVVPMIEHIVKADSPSSQNIPTLGTKHSHTGNEIFPAWE